MQHAQSRTRPRRRIGRGALAALGGRRCVRGLARAARAGRLVVLAFNGGLNNLSAVSGTVTGGFSAPVMLASSLGDLKIIPGQAVMLAADAISAEPVS